MEVKTLGRRVVYGSEAAGVNGSDDGTDSVLRHGVCRVHLPRPMLQHFPSS